MLQTYVMLIGHMAFATDPPFCLTYQVEYFDKKGPSTMTIQNPDNHPVALMVSNMVVC